MAILPITNVINVTITNTPQGLTEDNVNSVALFTNDPTTSFNIFEEVISPSQVAELYGTDSLTTKMANAMFAQAPNIRTGGGRLVIIPMLDAVSATPGDFTSADISANLASILLIDDGDLRVTVNGVNYDLTGLNFTEAEDFADIAEILQARVVDAVFESVDESGLSGIRVTSKKVGASSTVALAAVPGGSGTALNGSGYFNAAGGTSASGTDSTGETILEAIARTEGSVGYVGMLTTLSLEDDALEDIADGVQAMDKLFHYAGSSTQDILGVGTAIQQDGNTKTRFKIHTASIEEAILFNAAYVGRGHCVNFDGSNTLLDMNLKQLATISPDLGISQTNYTQAKTAGVDLYVSYKGLPAVVSNGGNDYFDNQYANLALKFALEAAGFNFLRQTNTKVPQTENGMNGLKSAYAVVCDRFVRNASIAPGSWTSSERFGDPEIFDNNILTRGYYIYSLPIVQQNATDREQRKAPLVQIAVKRAGSIQTSDVIVVVND